MVKCNICDKFHKISNLVYTAGTSLVIQFTDSTNIANRSKFCFCVNKAILDVVTGSPVQTYANINGANIPIYTELGTAYPLYSDLLGSYYRSNKCIHGRYVNHNNLVYLIVDLPRCGCENIEG